MNAGQKTPSTGNPPLLHTKLMAPRLNANVVRREDLLSRLDEGLSRKLTVVVAPTGFGKTTLVSMWVDNRQLTPAWVTLDPYDNDVTRFWTYVVSALRSLDPAVGKPTLSMLMAPQPSPFQTLLTPFINDLGRLTTDTVLVLEDFHVITSREILESVSFLIQHLPERLHILLITRVEPELPLHLLRVREEMLEINTADLRFRPKETERFLLQEAQIELSPPAITQLLQKTEGWVAGLRLIALSVRHPEKALDVESLIRSFSGRDRHVADYLIGEVFRTQSDAVQSFLLRTCFFSRLTGSLCDALTGATNGGRMLEQLERDNLFIVQLERSADQIWYRYNPVFAEAIQYLARQRLDETGIQPLFERASRWYEYHGLFDEAVETALDAGLFDQASALVEKFIEIHDLSEMTTLERWLEKIPPSVILLHPRICFTYAQVILYSEDRFAPATANRIEPFLSAAESAWQAGDDHATLGQLLSFRGNVRWWQGDFQKAFEYAYRSLDELPEHEVFWRGNSLLMIGYEALQSGQMREAQDVALEARALLGAAQNNFGVLAALQISSEIFYWQGDLEQTEQLNQQILAEAVGDMSMLDDQGIASLTLARVAYERNELDQAQQYAGRALELGVQRGNEMLQVQATIVQANLLVARGEYTRPPELLKSLESRIQNPSLLREIQSAQALLSIRAQDHSTLAWWIKIISMKDPTVLPLQQERETFVLARLRLAEDKRQEVIELVNDWQADAAENGRVRSQVEALCLKAMAYQADSRLADSTKCLSEALVIGHEKGFRRLFLDEGPRMLALLQITLPRLPNRSVSLYASGLLHSFKSGAMAASTEIQDESQLEPLSPQELRVLRLLAAGLSNPEIAQELVLSTNTIKTHIKSIYRKLSINSREDAREVARELRLL